MNSSFYIDTINWDSQFLTYLEVSGYNFQKIVLFCFLSKALFFTLINSVDPDEMLHFKGTHLGVSKIHRVNSHTVVILFNIPFQNMYLGA